MIYAGRPERLLPHSAKNLILIGMPGSGKSTIGRLVAERMGRPFVDTDEVIETEAGCAIPAIFEQEGEAGFRRRETAVLEAVGKESGLVIATGGGCVTSGENYFYLRRNGIILWLKRCIADLPRTGRPLSQSADLETLYTTRLPCYRRFAHRAIENVGDPSAAAEQVLEAFYETLSH